MKRIAVLGILALAVVLSAPAGLAQPRGPGYGPAPEGDWSCCPYCGRYLGPGGATAWVPA